MDWGVVEGRREECSWQALEKVSEQALEADDLELSGAQEAMEREQIVVAAKLSVAAGLERAPPMQ